MERRYFEKENLLPSSNAVVGQIYNGAWHSGSSTVNDTPPRRRQSLFGPSAIDSVTATGESEDISVPFALKNISVIIPPGSRVAVVGRTGSGKSSFLRTILNLNNHYRGQVLVGGMNIRDLSKHLLRRSCGESTLLHLSQIACRGDLPGSISFHWYNS